VAGVDQGVLVAGFVGDVEVALLDAVEVALRVGRPPVAAMYL